MDKTLAISIGYFSLGMAIMWIMLMGNPDNVESKPIPQGESQEDDKVRKPDFQKSKQAVG